MGTCGRVEYVVRRWNGCVCGGGEGGGVKVGWYVHVLVVLDKTFQMSILCSQGVHSSCKREGVCNY